MRGFLLLINPHTVPSKAQEIPLGGLDVVDSLEIGGGQEGTPSGAEGLLPAP